MVEKVIKLPFFGKRIIKKIIQKEGGEKQSVLARRIARNRKVDIDLYSYGSCFAEGFNTGGSVKIGRYCSFAPNVHYFGANHPMEQAVMTPYFYNKTFGFDVEDVHREELVVGNDVWVGYGTTINSKCHSIGNGAVIGGGQS